MKPVVTGEPADYRHLERIEDELRAVITKYRANTDEALIVTALVRQAGFLLSEWRSSLKTMVREGCLEFLKRDRTAVDMTDPANRLITFRH